MRNLNKDHVILNDNINENHIRRKGVHLNGKGSGRLAMNFLSHIRSKKQLVNHYQCYQVPNESSMPNFHNILVAIQTANAYITCVTLSKVYLFYFVSCLQIVRLIVPIIFTSNANNLLRSPYLANKFVTIGNSNFSNGVFYSSDKSVLRYLSLPCTQLITQANPKGTGHCAFSDLIRELTLSH